MHCYTSYSHLFLDHWLHLRRVLYPIVSVEKTLSSIPWPQDHLVKNDASDLYVAFQKLDTHWSQLVAPVFDMVFQDLAYVVLKRQINTEKTDVYTVSHRCLHYGDWVLNQRNQSAWTLLLGLMTSHVVQARRMAYLKNSSLNSTHKKVLFGANITPVVAVFRQGKSFTLHCQDPIHYHE